MMPGVEPRITGWHAEAARAEPVDGAANAHVGAVLSLRVAGRACRRRWRLCLAVALGGAVIGAGTHYLVPRTYSSSSNLYLSEPATSDATQAMANDVGLLKTRAVARRAVHALHLHRDAGSFLSSYTGLAQSDAILSITVSAPTQAEALSWNRAVDNAFLSLRAKEIGLQANAVVGGLRSQISSLEGEISNLSSSIAAATAQSNAQSANRLTDLIDQRNADQAQVTQLQGSIQQALTDVASVTHGSRVLDPPAIVAASSHKAIAMDTLSGLVAGLALGFGTVATRALLSDRPRRRDEVASLLGAPIELSLDRHPRARWFRRQRLRHRLEHPSPSLRMIERRLRAHLEAAPGHAMAVVTIGADDEAALAVTLLAVSLATEGSHVVLADVAKERPIAYLVGAAGEAGKVQAVTINGQELSLFVGTGDPVDMAHKQIPDDADVALVLAEPDPALGADHLAVWASNAVVLVARDRASAARIGAAGEMLRHADIAVSSAILLGAFPEDESLGTAPPRPPTPLSAGELDAAKAARW